MAAGTITLGDHTTLGHVRKMEYACTAGSTNATFPATVMPKFSGKILKVLTNPGATAPTADYDITITDANSIDVLNGQCADRSATVTEVANIEDQTPIPAIGYHDTLTINIANNSVNSALIALEITYSLGNF